MEGLEGYMGVMGIRVQEGLGGAMGIPGPYLGHRGARLSSDAKRPPRDAMRCSALRCVTLLAERSGAERQGSGALRRECDAM